MRSRVIDCFLALAFSGLGFAIGYRFLMDFGVANFGQELMPAAVMWACGHGLVDPASSPPALTAFLRMAVPSFDCRELMSVAHLGHASAAINIHLYLALAAAVSWRLLGVSYLSLSPMLGIFYGTYVAGCFVLLRLFFGRWLATFAAAILAISPVAVIMLGSLRDFSKAPFIIWAIVLLVLAIREQRSTRLIIIAGITGLIVGIGVGFRADLKLVALIAFVILAFGLNRDALALRARIAALCVFSVVFAIFGSFPGGTKGPGMGLYAFQGAAEPFRRFIGVTKPNYDVGYLYFDAYTIATIAADLRRPDPDAWDLHETTTADVHESYTMTRANDYVLDWLPLFTGDLVTRGLKSAAWIAGYYALFPPSHVVRDPHHIVIPKSPTFVVSWAEPYFRHLAQPWLPYLGILGCLALVFRTFDRSRREAACLSLILLVLAMSPGIQFSVDHLFQYEVIFWLGVLSLMSLPFEFNRLRKSLYPFACWVFALLLLGGTGYASVLSIQHYLLVRQVQQILDGKREPIARTVADLADGRKLVEIPIPPAATKLPGFSPEGVDPELQRTLFEFEHMRISALAVADRLLITIGGADCAAGELLLTLSYEGHLRFSRPLTIAVPRNGEKTLLVTSAFYTRLERFRGIAVPADRLSCIADVSKIVDSGRLPSTFTVILPPDWRSEPMFQRPGGF
jgi:hypothetical protein